MCEHIRSVQTYVDMCGVSIRDYIVSCAEVGLRCTKVVSFAAASDKKEEVIGMITSW